MGCEQWREALSAELDGENDPVEQAAVLAHLTACAGCRSWYDRAAGVTRRSRTTVASVPPDLSDRILAALPAGPPNRRVGRRGALGRTLRVGLGLVGAAQVTLGLTQVGQPDDGHQHLAGALPASAGHLWHESAAWNVAVGAGFLFVALRRSRPTGLLPTLTAFVATLLVLSVNDLIAARVDPTRLVSHCLIIVGYVIVMTLSRPAFAPDDPPVDGRRSPVGWRARFEPPEKPEARPARPDRYAA